MKNKINLIFLMIVLLGFIQNRAFAECPESVSCLEVNGQHFMVLNFANNVVPSNPAAAKIKVNYQGVNYSLFPSDLYVNTAIYPFAQCVDGLDLEQLVITLWTEEVCDESDFGISPQPDAVCPDFATCSIVSPPLNPTFWNCPTDDNLLQFVTGSNVTSPNFNNAQFYFENDPMLDGIYSPCGSVSGTNFTYNINCTTGPLTVIFEPTSETSSLTCVYDGNGTICLPPDCEPYFGPPCEDLFEECDKELISFVKNNVNDNCQQWKEDCGTDNMIWRNGQVAIGGDKFHDDFKLMVDGGIISEFFKLCNETNPIYWCDYVFEEDYLLMPLLEVDSFINSNGHLPKTKSSKEIQEEGGFEMTEVILNHQEKIEEMYLHLIDLDKQLSRLEEVIED